MPRSNIEMKALIKTERQERIQERIQGMVEDSNKILERKQKRKDLDKIKISVNPLIRLFVLPKIN